MVVRHRVSADDSYVYIDPNRLAGYVRQHGGPVMHDVDRRGSNVQTAARRFVGKDTRRLERSIVKRPGQDSTGPFVLVVTEGVDYSVAHHEPHGTWAGNPFLRDALKFAAR